MVFLHRLLDVKCEDNEKFDHIKEINQAELDYWRCKKVEKSDSTQVGKSRDGNLKHENHGPNVVEALRLIWAENKDGFLADVKIVPQEGRTIKMYLTKKK